MLKNLIKHLKDNVAVIPSIKSKDSVKYKVGNKYLNLKRKDVSLTQTPQAFVFKNLYNLAVKQKEDITDEASLFINNNQKVKFILGEQKNITLADGSKLHLNTDSIVTVDFTENARNIVLLRGEAHFDVAHDTSRPFTVTAGNNTVTAVGTAFNMQYVDDQAFELVVTDGKVLVADRFNTFNRQGSLFSNKPNSEEGLLLYAGEKAVVKGKVEEKENLSKNDIDDDLAWQKGMIVFKGEPLESVLEEIGRYTPVRFSISDEGLKRRRVAGYFKVGDIEGLLGALKNSFNIEYEKKIKKYFNGKKICFDLTLLGVGNDGHIASLFKNNINKTNKKNVDFVIRKDFKRITLTIKCINNSKNIFLWAPGKNKKKIIKNIIKDKTLTYPASYLKSKNNFLFHSN